MLHPLSVCGTIGPMSTSPGAPALGIRATARREVTARIRAEGRRQLASEGAAGLSLRAIARELGMVSSAVYRYVPSRDALLTELILESYSALAEVAEAANASVPDQDDLEARWRAVWRAIRGWAFAHPHDYALLYGSPVPGYRAPQDTVAPASRVTGSFAALLVPLATAGGSVPVPVAVPESLSASLESTRAFVGEGVPDDLLLRGLMAWAGMFGAISFELFGQYEGAFADRDTYFDYVIDQWFVLLGGPPA